MDGNTQNTFLLSDLSALGAVDTTSTDVVSQQSDEVQTVYTHLPAVLEGSGYRHIYVTVENPQDIASLDRDIVSLARSFGTQDVGLNQSNIVTVAVPTSQLINESGTLIIHPGDVTVSTETSSIPAEQEGAKSKEHKQHTIFSNANTVLAPLTHKDTEGAHSSVSKLLTRDQGHIGEHESSDTKGAYITQSTLSVQGQTIDATRAPQKDLVQLIVETEAAERQNAPPVPLVVCRCDARRDNVKTAQQIFTNVQANLAKQLMEKIPGCSATFLHQFTTQHDMHLQQPDDQTDDLQVSGDLHKLLCLHDNLSHLISVADCHSGGTGLSARQPKANPAPRAPAHGSVTKEKGVLCDLLQPQYSRSGRQIKRRNLDHPMDKDDSFNIESPSSRSNTAATGATKKRRGRPAKIPRQQEPVPLPQDLLAEKKVEVVKSEFDLEESLAEVITAQSHVCVEVLKTDNETDISQTISQTIDECVPQLSDGIVVEQTDSHQQMVQQDEVEDVPKEQGIGDVSVGDVAYSDDDVPDTNSLSEKENTQEGETPSDTTQLIANIDGVGYKTLNIRKMPAGIVLGRKRHKKDYESLAPFKFHCSMCSFKSKRKSHYLKHLQIHTKKSLPVLQCAQCAFTTIRLSHLRRHQLSHSANVYTCKVCTYKTDDVKRLSRHHRIKHTLAQPEPEISVIYQCEQCEYKTLKSHQYVRHLRCHSTLCPDSAGQTCSSYQCPLCPYKTQRKEHYSRHVANVHSDRRPFLCDLCGKAFKRPDALRQHKMVHQDKQTRPFRYTCPDCLKGFRSHAHLVEHRTIHTDERSYLCEICGAAFKTRSVQRKHVQTIHQNPRAYSCTSCDKRFNTKYALQRHLRTHNTPGMRTLSLAMEQLGEGTTVAMLPATTDTTQIIHELRETTVEEEEQAMVVETIVAGEGATATIQQQYVEETADGAVQQLPQTAYIQTTNEETTALLYLTSLPTY